MEVEYEGQSQDQSQHPVDQIYPKGYSDSRRACHSYILRLVRHYSMLISCLFSFFFILFLYNIKMVKRWMWFKDRWMRVSKPVSLSLSLYVYVSVYARERAAIFLRAKLSLYTNCLCVYKIYTY